MAKEQAVTLKKGKRTIQLANDIQISAFKNNGWQVVVPKAPK